MSMTDRDGKLTHFMEGIVQKCVDQDVMTIFTQPVDRNLYPEYYQMVENPMDLGTFLLPSFVASFFPSFLPSCFLPFPFFRFLQLFLPLLHGFFPSFPPSFLPGLGTRYLERARPEPAVHHVPKFL
jgi:hypothetical protein